MYNNLQRKKEKAKKKGKANVRKPFRSCFSHCASDDWRTTRRLLVWRLSVNFSILSHAQITRSVVSCICDDDFAKCHFANGAPLCCSLNILSFGYTYLHYKVSPNMKHRSFTVARLQTQYLQRTRGLSLFSIASISFVIAITNFVIFYDH